MTEVIQGGSGALLPHTSAGACPRAGGLTTGWVIGAVGPCPWTPGTWPNLASWLHSTCPGWDMVLPTKYVSEQALHDPDFIS